ncbi:MAG: Jag N-terminal domain-containing protein [Sulfurospirillum sp.]
MTRIEANTLQQAYLDAARELKCSITELDIEIIQNSSTGFLGMFKKSAIIEVSKKSTINERKTKNHRNKREKKVKKESLITEKQNVQIREKNTSKPRRQKIEKTQKTKNESKKEENKLKKPPRREPKKQELKVDIDKAIDEIRVDINRLFKESCFEMDDVKVSKFNDDTIYLEFGGADAALLIGKEGYRYKALSYFLYNWISTKYGANIRLEIAEFLKNQEEMISKYLIPVIERVRNGGRGQTKTLDGVLIKIALEKLRNEFPEKYVGIKSARSGGRFIVINDFNRKNK